MQRDEIILSAAQIFREKGFHATSMQDIADSVQLQKASLYHHIDSKQQILLEVLDRALDVLIEDIEPIVDSDITPEGKLKSAMTRYIERVTRSADLAAVLLLEHRSLEPALRASHIERRDRFEELWRTIVREGVERGDFRPMDPSVVTFALLGVQNWLITWYREGGRLNGTELADRFAELFLNGLSASRGSSSE
ncbi:MAG: TetR/AcrR family transcriptional regulator [Anaerolineales bacterium]